MHTDFSPTAHEYATHRADFPGETFARLAALGVGLPGQRLLDLGTGTGALARPFASRGCRVLGVDISAAMLEAGRQMAEARGLAVEWRCAPAEKTGLAAESVDCVSAGQCWHWFDRPSAAREAFRVLVPGGKLAIAHFDWLGGPVIRDSLALADELGAVAPPVAGLAIRGIYPYWPDDVEGAGFVDINTASFDVAVPYSREAWRGRMRASALYRSLSEAARAEYDKRLRARLETEREPLQLPHRVFYLVATKPHA